MHCYVVLWFELHGNTYAVNCLKKYVRKGYADIVSGGKKLARISLNSCIRVSHFRYARKKHNCLKWENVGKLLGKYPSLKYSL